MDPSPSPWEEALDIDDSDLSPTPLPLSLSVLRPCRQRLHHQTQVSLPPPQNQNPPHPLSSSSFSCRLIPGPAGAVQAAMHRRRNFNSGNFPFRTDNNTNCNNPISTQEYFRRIDYDSARDDDFTSNSWVLANDFVRSQCKVDGVSSSTPLDSVKKCPASDRVPLVVAIIQSSTPNGLGDLMITLKDPTGTIGATIHRKVLSQEEFAKDISVGAVMILQKVATFSPSRTAHYLNITLNNVIKAQSLAFCAHDKPPYIPKA
ncbi:Homologous recombination OB-fold protein [Dillenia turbinata]|uniref:Homologous recombination OB-fold protein n=1 Tax=Dillenia turbinata TaxID=194707 RepID=A0AAN8UT56_9MAGN